MKHGKPNIVLIYADDLGRGMLSCYGQRHFSTPNIDAIAGAGTRFTHSYGCAFCAPARASLLTGIHDCHAGRWSYTQGGVYDRLSTGELSYAEVAELINTTGFRAGANEAFLPQLLKESGYVTGQIGKLEWGFATTAQRLRRHGWDYHYGYYDHRRCHGFFPPYLFRNGQIERVRGNTRVDCGKAPENESAEHKALRWDMNGKAVYSQDLFDRDIVSFIRTNRERPFFLFHPSQLPHGPICVPTVHPKAPRGDEFTDYEREYASMVLRLDDTVGLIRTELSRLGLLEDTVFLFTSDNGHCIYYREAGRTTGRECHVDGTPIDDVTTRATSELNGDVFNGNDGMSGVKWTSWEGGTRVPLLVSWPGRIAPRSDTGLLTTNYDILPTLAEIAGVQVPEDKDGLSFLPAAVGEGRRQALHDEIVFGSELGPALVTREGWKLRSLRSGGAFQLYHLPTDYREERDVSADNPDMLRRLSGRLLAKCDGDLRHGTPQLHRAVYRDSLDGAAG